MRDDKGLFEDTMNEVQEEMHRLMALHLELMDYFRRVCDDAENAQRSETEGERIGRVARMER